MQGQGKTIYPYGKFRLLFNVFILILSVSLTLFIIFVWIWDYLIRARIVLVYIASALVSLLCFYYLKVVLLKSLSSDVIERVEVHEPVGGSGGKQTRLLFVIILLMLVTPLIVLFLIPDLALVILNGIVSGASISELILYLRKRR